MSWWERFKRRYALGAFFSSILDGDVAAVRAFIEDPRLDANATIHESDRHGIVERGTTALMYAAGAGHSEVAELLLHYGADPNGHDAAGGTALMLAASHGDSRIVSLLAKRGADVDAMADNGATALRLAEAKGHVGTAKLLRELGATDYGDPYMAGGKSKRVERNWDNLPSVLQIPQLGEKVPVASLFALARESNKDLVWLSPAARRPTEESTTATIRGTYHFADNPGLVVQFYGSSGNLVIRRTFLIAVGERLTGPTVGDLLVQLGKLAVARGLEFETI